WSPCPTCPGAARVVPRASRSRGGRARGPGLFGQHLPLRLLELPNDADLDLPRMLGEDPAHRLAAAVVLRVPVRLRFPGGDREQGVGLADLAMKKGAAG